MLINIFHFLCVGVFAGFSAGLLGLGGGIVVVPALFFLFHLEGFPNDSIAHLAVATSLATMMFTATSSFLTHLKFGFVDKEIYKKIILGLLFGIFVGAYLALSLTTHTLKYIFATFLLVVAFQMFLDKKKKNIPSNSYSHLNLPLFWSFVFGGFSSLLGIGAGSTFVPYLNLNKVNFNKAVGTASAITLTAAIWGTISFLVVGHFFGAKKTVLELIYWPAVFSIAFTSVIFAYFGARLSHKTSASILRKVFAIFVIGVAVSIFLSN